MFAKIIAAIKNFIKSVFAKAPKEVVPETKVEVEVEAAQESKAFDPSKFTMPARSYALCGVLGRGDDQDKLKERFGSNWKRIPGCDNVLFAADRKNNIQLTLKLDATGEPIEFAVYLEPSVEDFKTKFLAGQYMDAGFHQINPKYKYIGLQVVEVLKAEGVW